jgi:hypothetical protein
MVVKVAILAFAHRVQNLSRNGGRKRKEEKGGRA